MALGSTAFGGQISLAAPVEIDTINILSPFSGGSFDQTCRATAKALSGAKLVNAASVESINGGDGARAYEQLVQRGISDAYTIILIGTSIIARSSKGVFPYKIRDLTTVARLSMEPLVFAAKANSRFTSVRDLIAALKANPTSVRFASDSDVGLSEHLCLAKMLTRAGINPKEVAYSPKTGHGKHIEAMLRGDVDVIVAAAADILESYQNKSAHVLAVSAENRIETLPYVPTLAETGVRDAVFYNARGFFMAPTTDTLRAHAMYDVLEKMVTTKEWKAAAQQADVTTFFAPLPQAEKFFRDQEAEVRDLQIALGLKKGA